MLRKLARWPLTCLLYMPCPNIDTCQWGIIACLFIHVRTVPYTQFDLGNRPTAVIRGQGGGIFRLFYFPTFQEPHLPIQYMEYKYMHVTPDLGEFFSFSFSRVHDCIHYPCKGAAVSQCQPNLASCHNVKFWFLIKKNPGLVVISFPLLLPFFLPIFLLDF